MWSKWFIMLCRENGDLIKNVELHCSFSVEKMLMYLKKPTLSKYCNFFQKSLFSNFSCFNSKRLINNDQSDPTVGNYGFVWSRTKIAGSGFVSEKICSISCCKLFWDVLWEIMLIIFFNYLLKFVTFFFFRLVWG